MCWWVHNPHNSIAQSFPSFDFLGLGSGMKSRTSFLNACMVGLDIVVG